MTKTKILIASSAENLKTDNLETESFITRLNNCYVDRGLYFTPVLSIEINDIDNRNREVAESSVAFFILNAETSENIRDIYKAGFEHQ